MIAVLRWTDGFGHDTYVKAIYPTLEQAKQYFSEGDRWVEFNYGLVDFDWYEANEFREIKHKKKKKKARYKKMKVTTNNKEAVFFREITTGTFFFYEGNLFLKVNESDKINAYCFEDEEFEDFYTKDLVIPIPTDRISINVM